MAKFPEAEERLFKNKFVCKKCNKVQRTSSLKVSEGKVRCRNCMRRSFKTKRKK